jgi:hypothetical protein
MINRVSDWLNKISTGWVTLLALIVFLLFSALVLPSQASRAEAETGDAGGPDTSLFYSSEDLYRWAEEYGPAGRAAYIRTRFTFDVIWPLVYTVFLVTATSWVYRQAFRADSRWRRLNLAPILGAAFDFLENISAAIVMGRYPDQTPLVDTLAPVFTLLKWVLIGASFVSLVIGVGVGLWRWLKKRGQG